MFIRFYWWLLNKRYCLGCHKMTAHNKTVYHEFECKKCKKTKFDLLYFDLIEKIKIGKEVTSKDHFTKEFIQYVKENYKKTNSILINKATGQIVESEKLIYYNYRQYQYEQKIKALSNSSKIDRLIGNLICIMTLIVIIYFIYKITSLLT